MTKCSKKEQFTFFYHRHLTSRQVRFCKNATVQKAHDNIENEARVRNYVNHEAVAVFLGNFWFYSDFKTNLNFNLLWQLKQTPESLEISKTNESSFRFFIMWRISHKPLTREANSLINFHLITNRQL